MPLHPVRSTLPLVAALAGTLAGAACGERATGPATATVPVALVLAFPGGAGGADAVFGAGIDRVRVNISRPNESFVLDTTYGFPAGDEGLRIAVDVPVLGRADTVYLSVNLLEGQAVLFNAGTQVVVRQGSLPSIPALPLVYVGPGWNATTVAITGRSFFLQPGGTLAMSATARDPQGLPVPVPIAWSVSDLLIGSIDAAGLFTARQRTGSTWVRALTANGLRDSVLVTVATQLP